MKIRDAEYELANIFSLHLKFNDFVNSNKVYCPNTENFLSQIDISKSGRITKYDLFTYMSTNQKSAISFSSVSKIYSWYYVHDFSYKEFINKFTTFTTYTTQSQLRSDKISGIPSINELFVQINSYINNIDLKKEELLNCPLFVPKEIFSSISSQNYLDAPSLYRFVTKYFNNISIEEVKELFIFNLRIDKFDFYDFTTLIIPSSVYFPREKLLLTESLELNKKEYITPQKKPDSSIPDYKKIINYISYINYSLQSKYNNTNERNEVAEKILNKSIGTPPLIQPYFRINISKITSTDEKNKRKKEWDISNSNSNSNKNKDIKDVLKYNLEDDDSKGRKNSFPQRESDNQNSEEEISEHLQEVLSSGEDSNKVNLYELYNDQKSSCHDYDNEEFENTDPANDKFPEEYLMPSKLSQEDHNNLNFNSYQTPEKPEDLPKGKLGTNEEIELESPDLILAKQSNVEKKNMRWFDNNVNKIKIMNEMTKGNPFQEFFTQELVLNERLRKSKMKLSSSINYDPLNAFMNFVKENKGYITKEDLIYKSIELNCYIDDSDIDLFFILVNQNQKGIIEYKEFIDFISADYPNPNSEGIEACENLSLKEINELIFEIIKLKIHDYKLLKSSKVELFDNDKGINLIDSLRFNDKKRKRIFRRV